MKCLVLGILCIAPFSLIFHCSAIDLFTVYDARSYSMGNVQSVLPGFTNPASFGFTSASRYFSLQYINRYGIKELSTWSGAINFPNKYLNTGFFISRYGMKAFHETFSGLNMYRRLSDRISLGIRISYLNIHYSDKEPNKSAFSADIGLLVSVLEQLKLSVLVINPFCLRMKIGNTKEKLPSVIFVGACYELLQSLMLTGEIEKNFVLPVSCKLGFEYIPIKELSVRAGFFTSPLTPTFGVGVRLLPFTIDLAFSKYSVLGFQSSCSLKFNF